MALSVVVLVSLLTFNRALAAECTLENPIGRASPLSDNKVFSIEFGGNRGRVESRRILLNWSDLPATDTTPPDGVPDIANQFVDKLTSYLDKIANEGFRVPPGAARKCDYTNVITAFLYQAAAGANSGGNASGNKFDVRFSASSLRRGTIFADTSPSLIHEIFHLVNGQYDIGTTRRNWLEEGTATLSSDVFDADQDNAGSVGQDSCRRQVLRSPEKSLFRRNSKFNDGTNVCGTSLYWRYLTEQLGRSQTEPAYGLDALHTLYERLEHGGLAWRYKPTDRIHGTGDFDGDGRHEMVVTSNSHLGVFASSQADTRLLDVRAFGFEIERNWTLRHDDKIHGIGDFNGDGVDEFLIQNNDFIALIHASRDGTLKVLSGTSTGPGVFRNWRPDRADQLIAIGDFDADGKDEALFRGRNLIGMLELNNSGSLSAPQATSLSELARRLGREPRVMRVISTGRFRNDSREEILAQDEQGMFLWGLNRDGRFSKIHSIDYGQRAGSGWVLNRSDKFHGAIDFRELAAPANAREIIVQSRVGLGILGFNPPAAADGEPVLVTRHVVGLNRDLGSGFSYTADTVVVGFERLGDSRNAQIVIRNDNKFAVLSLSNQYRPRVVGTLDLTGQGPAPAAGWTPAELDSAGVRGLFNVEPEPVLLSGGGRPFVIGPDNNRTGLVSIPGGARRLLLRYVPNSGLVLENRDIYGTYLRSLIGETDAFIRARAPGRSFESMWHDLAIALYTKNLELDSLDTKYRIIDEIAPGVITDTDADPSTPPVKTRSGSARVHSNPWSKNYWHIPASNAPRTIQVSYDRLLSEQRAVTRTDIDVEPRRVGIHLIVVQGNRLVSVTRNINPGFSKSALREISLAPGQSLGVVAVNTTDMLSYQLNIDGV